MTLAARRLCSTITGLISANDRSSIFLGVGSVPAAEAARRRKTASTELRISTATKLSKLPRVLTLRTSGLNSHAPAQRSAIPAGTARARRIELS